MPRDVLDLHIIKNFWAKKSQEPRNRWTKAEMLTYELATLRQITPVPRSILDLGSGSGHLSRPLAGSNAKLTAVDFAPAYAKSFNGENHEFVACPLDEFETEKTFDLILLFGVVTFLDEKDEIRIAEKIRGWLAAGGTAVVKNQCALGEEFVRTGWSDVLQAEYSGRYPNVEEQAARLRRFFYPVKVLRYPAEFNVWPDSIHVAFLCSGTS